MSKPHTLHRHQGGRYVLKWVAGVIVATALVGAGLFFGLTHMQGSKTANRAPIVEPRVLVPDAGGAPAVSTAAPVDRPDDGSQEMAVMAPGLNSNASAIRAPGGAIEDSLETPASVDQRADQPANEEQEESEPLKPRTRIAPKAPTTGGVAAARLPTGEEILVPAGQRVDEYIAREAANRGLIPANEAYSVENVEDPGNAVTIESGITDEMSAEELLNQQLLDQALFNDGEVNVDDIVLPEGNDAATPPSIQ